MSDETPRSPDGQPLWYGRRRKHKLRPRRAQLIETLLPALRIAAAQQSTPVNVAEKFGRHAAEIHLEIGFGAGEHLSGVAAAEPDVNFIGCEPFINGVASLLADIERDGLTNIRLFDEDARQLLPRLPDAAVSKIYLLFPDPWPKTRHNRRRFVQQDALSELARIARDDAIFIFASDHTDYVAWTLAEVQRHPDWVWSALRPDDWRRPPPGWVQTRYEAKGRKKGDLPAYLVMHRVPRR